MPHELASSPPLLSGSTSERANEPRASASCIARERDVAARSPMVVALLTALDSVLLVLNEERRIVAFSAGAATVARSTEIHGLRPGEALACVNAQTPEGCGAAPACQTCGALGAIRTARRARRPADSECLLRSVAAQDGAYEFTVRAVPVTVEDIPFTLLSLHDVSAQKRRDALERIFLHDVSNTVVGLSGWASRLGRLDRDPRPAVERIAALTRRLQQEIRAHRDLIDAERGTLTLSLSEVDVAGLFAEVRQSFAWQRARMEQLAVHVEPAPLALRTDRALLLRVLDNMVRNALEASAPGARVRVRGAQIQGGPGGDVPRIRLSVHNEGEMPPDVQHRIFVRSFSTKAVRGHGLGTYGMKLLGERYLGGEVSFVSSAQTGTVFWIELEPSGPAAR